MRGEPKQDDELNGLLVYALVHTFVKISTADGAIDNDEIQVFRKSVKQHFCSDSAYEAVGIRLQSQLTVVLGESRQSGDAPIDSITRWVDLAEAQYTAERWLAGRELIYRVGRDVAGASGGGPFGLGGSISKAEDTALRELARWLQLDAEG
jgi:hypothetical protein